MEPETKCYTNAHKSGSMNRFHVLDVANRQEGVLFQPKGEYLFNDNPSIIVGGTIYVIGGSHNIAVKIPPWPQKIVQFRRLASTSLAQVGVGLVQWRQQYIYRVCSDNILSQLCTCEKYSIARNTWTALPRLNSQRCEVDACIMNDRLLYAVGGEYALSAGERVYLSVERLDLLDEEGGWTLLSLRGWVYPSSWEYRTCQLNVGELLMFGDGKHSYVISENEVRLEAGMKFEDKFWGNKSVVAVKGKIHAMSNESCVLYTYCMKRKVWTKRMAHFNE